MQLPDHMSASQINCYLRCSLSYKFKYLDCIATEQTSSALVLGSAFHLAAEKLHRDLMNGGPKNSEKYRDVLGDALTTDFGCLDVLTKDGEDRDTLIEEGDKLLDIYIDFRTKQKTKIVAAEQRVERQLVNVRTGEILEVPFVGYIDLIEEDSDGLTVVDLKTAKRSYSQADVDGNLQLSCYGLMGLLDTGSIPRLRIDAVVRNKVPKVVRLETSRTEDDLVRFWSLAVNIRSAIEAGVFLPCPSWACPTCDYTEECRLWGSESNGEER